MTLGMRLCLGWKSSLVLVEYDTRALHSTRVPPGILWELEVDIGDTKTRCLQTWRKCCPQIGLALAVEESFSNSSGADLAPNPGRSLLRYLGSNRYQVHSFIQQTFTQYHLCAWCCVSPWNNREERSCGVDDPASWFLGGGLGEKGRRKGRESDEEKSFLNQGGGKSAVTIPANPAFLNEVSYAGEH